VATRGSGWYDQFTGYAPSPSGANAMTRTGMSDLHRIRVLLLRFRVPLAAKSGMLNYTVTVALYAADGNHQPAGSALCSTSFTKSSLPVWATTWRTYAFATLPAIGRDRVCPGHLR